MVKELNQYWQSQKQATLSLFHTETLLESDIITIQDTNGIATGTGTTGTTIDGDTQNITGDGMIGFTVLILLSLLGAHLIDRNLNRSQESNHHRDLDQDSLYNQENQNQE